MRVTRVTILRETPTTVLVHMEVRDRDVKFRKHPQGPKLYLTELGAWTALLKEERQQLKLAQQRVERHTRRIREAEVVQSLCKRGWGDLVRGKRNDRPMVCNVHPNSGQ